jgi:type IV pilus assembly protein PilW
MKPSYSKCRFAASGFGLVELMVAIAIGLIMSLALSYFFLGSQKSSRVHDDSSRMQENARNALDIMGRAIRQAGYTVDYKGLKTTPFDSISASNGASATTPDSITVRYEGQVDGETDCAGAVRASGVPLVFAFAVNGSLQLTCTNAAGTEVVVADNVENMQITYGVDASRSGNVASPYVDTTADFSKVAVVKVILTMRGTTADTANGGVDGYVRQTYSASYTVRNQAG